MTRQPRTFVLLAVTLLACSSPRSPGTPSLPEGSEVPPLASSVPTDWSAPIDFDQIRSEWGLRDDFEDLCGPAHQRLDQLEQLIGKQEWEGVASLTADTLSKCPVSIQFHAYRLGALEKLGRQAESEQHRRWARGLLESVLRTGDGKSPETAYVVISIAEEYAVLGAQGFRSTSQASLENGIDAIGVSDGKIESTIYFDPHAHHLRMMRALDALKP